MGGDVLSGGVVVLLAAVLWLAYLLPTWLRRREFQATERNAVRLQQTLRILAATSELPDEVRVEATAREVAVQQRILRKAEARTRAELQARATEEAARRHEEAMARAEADARAAATPHSAPMTDAPRARARRLRRARAATALLLVVGLVAAVWGLVAALALGGSWLVPAGAVVAAGGAFGNLCRLAGAGRNKPVVVAVETPRVVSELFDHAASVESAPAALATWTPRPLPKPLYQSPGSVAASAMASVDAVTRLRRAAAAAELHRRAAELAEVLSPEVARLTPRPVAEPAASAVPAPLDRYARMGMLEGVEASALDLDAALRRRRAAG
ncbi:MAG: hypothetical protein EPN48_17785 [Microbacteriaceae bacterium]|nr:MAG: hypothetical protein EPN48_17785 [Microbacteriaceae bacterium]